MADRRRALAWLTATLAGSIACSTPYAADDLRHDAGGPRTNPGSTVPGSGLEAGVDAGSEAAAPSSSCDGLALCLHFDGSDPPAILVQKGGAVVENVNGDSVSAPGALHGNAKTGDYAGFQWALGGKFTPTTVLTIRMSFKELAIGAATSLPIIAFLKIGTTAELMVGIDGNHDVVLLWATGSAQETGRATLGTWTPSAWNSISFVVSAAGVSAIAGGPVLAAPQATLGGDLSLGAGAVSYVASDDGPFSVLLDDVTIRMTP